MGDRALRTLYVTEPGMLIRKKSLRVVVEKAGIVKMEVPVMNMEQVFIFGNAQITSQAAHLLMEKEIDVVFFSSKGKFRGRLSGASSKNVFVKIAQFDAWRDETYKLKMSQRIVEGKIENMIHLLKKYQYYYPDLDLKQSINSLQRSVGSISEVSNIQSLMGVEGYASGVYFKAFSNLFRKELKFEKRMKNPSPDPVNALLSLGYVMITNEIASLLEGSALDPYLGFLHSIRYGRKSLALDLVEQFRQPVIDSFTIRISNLEVFKHDDFETPTNQGVYLKPDAFKKYLELYENHLSKAVNSKMLNDEVLKDAETIRGTSVNWRRLIYEKTKAIEKNFLEQTIYEPFTEKDLKLSE